MTKSTRHSPKRTCLVCGEKNDKRSLVRLVRTSEGLIIDPTGKQDGRGAYLCDNIACWHRASETNVVNKALRMTLSPQDRERIRRAQPS